MMKLFWIIAAALMPVVLAAGLPAGAAPVAPPTNAVDSVPATSNISGAEYPRLTSDLRVVFRVKAPDAQKVEFDLGKHYTATKGTDGDWTATTDPQVPGFHYYFLVIDGVSISDPSSETFYGTGREASGIEIPEKGVDFYQVKDVPQGEVRERRYFSKTTGAWRRIFVYTPPGYDTKPGQPVPRPLPSAWCGRG